MFLIASCRHGGIPASPSDHYALEVDLLCFSSGGGEHPSAREPTFCVRDFCRTDGATMEMEIRADLVVLLQEHRAKPEFLIFDWNTARNIAVSVIGVVNHLTFDTCYNTTANGSSRCILVLVR